MKRWILKYPKHTLLQRRKANNCRLSNCIPFVGLFKCQSCDPLGAMLAGGKMPLTRLGASQQYTIINPFKQIKAMTTINGVAALRALYDPARERSVLKELPALDAHARRFIALSPFVVISTYGSNGSADASPRGGDPGFVKVTDDQTLIIPDSPGNNRLDSLQNIIETGQIGLLFLVPGMDETLRVNGMAQLSTDESLRVMCTDTLSGKPRVPKLVMRVNVQASYLHCAKALMRSDLWNPARHIERASQPSMGEMLRDQVGTRMRPETAFETQEQMLKRYRETL